MYNTEAFLASNGGADGGSAEVVNVDPAGGYGGLAGGPGPRYGAQLGNRSGLGRFHSASIF